MKEGKRERRRQFTAEEKAIILRRHLSEKVAVSDLCEEYKIQPSLFYVWQRQAFENLGVALEDRRTGARSGTDGRASAGESAKQKQTIARLEAQLQKKDSIIAFVSEEHLALKKKLGES